MGISQRAEPSPSSHVAWLLGLAVLIVLTSGDALATWTMGAPAFAVNLPPTLLLGTPLTLLAIAVPTEIWQVRQAMRAHREQVRQRKIEQRTPLARMLGLAPQTLDRATLAGLLALDDVDFPKAMGHMLSAEGYRDVKVIDGPGDHGIDVICLSPDGKHVVAVQCKRYEHDKVAEREIREFLGATLHHHMQPEHLHDASGRGAREGLFFTTSDYKQSASGFTKPHEDPEKRYLVSINLYNGEKLVDRIRELAVQ